MAFDAGAVIGRLELDIAGWKKSVETVKKDQTSLSGLVMRHEQQFKTFGKAIALAGGAVVASFGAMVIKSANVGDAINDMSQRTGIATDILSGHKLALDKSGSSLEGFAVGMRGLSRVMDDANKGGKESQEVFADLGVSFADNEGKLRPLNDVLLDVANVFAQMPDGPEKAALAMKTFGRSGMELIPMLNMGKQGLIDNYEATKKLGGIWSKEAAQAADKFNDSLAELKMGGAGLAKEIGSILMPTVQSFVGIVTGIAVKVREWAAEHPGLASGLVKTAAGLGVMAAALGPVLIALPSLVKHIQILKAMSATPIIITIMIAIPVLAKAIADFKAELSNMRDSMKEADSSGFVAFMEGVNSGWRRVALGIKDSNVVLSEANALARLYATEGGRGMKDVILEVVSAADNLGSVLKALGIKTRTELTTELKAAEDALKKLKNSVEATPGQIKALEDKIAGLKEAMSGMNLTTGYLAAALRVANDSLKALNATGKAMPADIFKITEEIRKLKEEMGQTHPELLATSLGLLTKTQADQKLKTLVAAYLELAEKGLLTNASVRSFVDQIQALEKELDLTKGHFDGLSGTIGSFANIAVQMFRSIQFEAFIKARDGIAGFREKIDQTSGSLSIFSPFMLRIIQDVKNLGQAAADSGVQLKSQLATELMHLEERLRLFQKTQSLTAPQAMQMVAQIINLYKQMGLAVPKEWQKIYDAAAKASGNIKYVAASAADTTKSIWQEVSTVIADSMRNIASEIVGMVDFKGLFGAAPKAVKFDSSYYDQMVAAATSAYDKERSLIEANADARVEAARRAFDAQELLISRAEEDADRRLERRQDAEDRKYEAQYERDKRAIENSKMSEEKKQAALEALEKKYEGAKLAREIAREDAKVARERAREDARLARELAQEKKIEAMRAATLKKLFDLQAAHQAQLDGIRAAEDAARQKQADDEEKRQKSLWFKVKGIFATAVEQMATIFLTRMFEPVGSLIGDLAAKLVGKGKDTVAGALDGVGGKVQNLGTTIGNFIAGIGAGIGGFISGLATGIAAAIVSLSSAIATAMVALATGIASAATIIAAAAPAIIVTSLLGMGIMAGLSLLKRIFSSGSAGAGDGMGRVVERQDVQTGLLKMIRETLNDNIKPTLWKISSKEDVLKTVLYAISHKADLIKDKIVTADNYLRTCASYLKQIASDIANLPHAAGGGVFMEPSLVSVAERRPEVVVPLNDYRAGVGGGTPIYVTMPIYLGTEKVDERMYRIANNRVEWLHSQYEHSNRMIPLRSIGGG